MGIAVDELIETIVCPVHCVGDVGVDTGIVVETICVTSLMKLSAVVGCEVVVGLVLEDWIVPAIAYQDLQLVRRLIFEAGEEKGQREWNLTALRSIGAVPGLFILFCSRIYLLKTGA